jgi:hypothetical protein
MWSKKLIRQSYKDFLPKIGFFGFLEKILIFFPNGLKIGVPTIFTIFYPNLQKKMEFCEIFENFWKKSKIRLFGKSRIKNPKNKKKRKFFLILCLE